MKRFGLVGRNISYSFSQKYFTEKFEKLNLENYRYDIFDINNIDEIKTVFEIPDIQGFNVTIPFKEQIIPFLDALSDEAEKIGAVNTVKISDGKKIGFNTDAFGFEDTLKKYRKNFQTKAILLGDGGAAKAVKYVLNKNEIPFVTVSRKSEINFENLSPQLVENRQIIVQCTPVGTFPDIENFVNFPFDAVTPDHLIVDLIYNPAETAFMKKCAAKGAICVNGLNMLQQQAEKAWEIWQV